MFKFVSISIPSLNLLKVLGANNLNSFVVSVVLLAVFCAILNDFIRGVV